MGSPLDTHGPGALGTPTNKPLIDRGTNARSANRPSGKQCDDNPAVNLAFKGTAWALLLGVGSVQDKYAFEIFSLWFIGASDNETFHSAEWAAYMSADKRLPGEIAAELKALAYGLRRLSETTDEAEAKVETKACGVKSVSEKKPGLLKGTFSRTFHAEVGSAQGEFRTGYDVLHGSNKDAGDFVINGQFSAVLSGPPGSACTVTYEGMDYTFNDIVDANKRWKADTSFARLAANMAGCMGQRPPRDYFLHIKWKAESPIKIELEPEGQAPPGLKVFQESSK